MTRLLLSKSSQKFIKKLKDKNLKNKIKDGLDKIKDNYTLGERKTGDLKGFWYFTTRQTTRYVMR